MTTANMIASALITPTIVLMGTVLGAAAYLRRHRSGRRGGLLPVGFHSIWEGR